jgi:hypothetical protein
VIRTYHHLGEDVGVSEAKRFTTLLTSTIQEILSNTASPSPDSPVYKFIEGLRAPAIEETRILVARQKSKADESNGPASITHSALMKQVDQAVAAKDFARAKTLLAAARALNPETGRRGENPYILQRLALLTYKSKSPTEEAALREAKDLLAGLEPQTSNDTETLGLWGAIHKRLWKLTKEPADLDEAVRAYERGFYIRNDYYNGINFAFLLNLRAANAANPADAIADFVVARRVRREVIEICEKLLADSQGAEIAAEDAEKLAENRYWVLATLAEALVGVEDPRAAAALATAYASIPPNKGWMRDSTEEQIGSLKGLLADSPLKRIV